jgi:ubiquinone/menaquinone biosynthesis C-methylase UbiE
MTHQTIEPFRGSTALVVRDEVKKYWFFNPELAEVYETFYEGKYKETDILEKEALSAMLKHFPDAKRILDVGCGTGHFTRWYAELGYDTVGLDISPIMLNVAIRLWDGPFYNAPAEKLPFDDQSFDVISYVTCTEYMPDLRPVLKQARRVGRQGVIIGLMNKWSFPTLRRKIQVWLGKNPYYTTATFRSPGEIRRLCVELFGEDGFAFDWIGTAFPKWLGGRAAKKPLASFVALAITFQRREGD